jgi:hypothetical protein
MVILIVHKDRNVIVTGRVSIILLYNMTNGFVIGYWHDPIMCEPEPRLGIFRVQTFKSAEHLRRYSYRVQPAKPLM